MYFFKRRTIAAAVFFLIVAGLAVFVLFASRSPAQKKTSTAAPSPTGIARLANREIASRIVHWADGTRTENGGYAEAENCRKDGTCEPLVVDNRIGAVGLWAWYRNYLDTKSYESTSIMAKDIQTYTNPAKVPTIQPNFWNCKLLYELWKSSDFTQDQKDDIQIICARALYNTFDLTFPEGVSVEETAKLQATQETDGKRLSSELVFLEPVQPDRLYEYAVNASERAAMWQWAAQAEDMTQSHLYFMGAVEALRATADRGAQADMASLVGIAALDINKIDPSPAFPNYAKYLFKTYANDACTTLEYCTWRAWFYNELYKRDGDVQYKNARDKVLSALYDTKFDSEGLKGYALGKQAYYDAEQKNRYWMVPNLMLSGLLEEIK